MKKTTALIMIILWIVVITMLVAGSCGSVPTPPAVPPVAPQQAGLDNSGVLRVVDLTYNNVCYVHLGTGNIDCLPIAQP